MVPVVIPVPVPGTITSTSYTLQSQKPNPTKKMLLNRGGGETANIEILLWATPAHFKYFCAFSLVAVPCFFQSNQRRFPAMTAKRIGVLVRFNLSLVVKLPQCQFSIAQTVQSFFVFVTAGHGLPSDKAAALPRFCVTKA